jgi:hypothetical protein
VPQIASDKSGGRNTASIVTWAAGRNYNSTDDNVLYNGDPSNNYNHNLTDNIPTCNYNSTCNYDFNT